MEDFWLGHGYCRSLSEGTLPTLNKKSLWGELASPALIRSITVDQELENPSKIGSIVVARQV